MTTQAPMTLSQHLRRIKDLPAFSQKSGIPYRTLFRIKNAPEHNVSTSTRLAIEGALKRFKPDLKDDDDDSQMGALS